MTRARPNVPLLSTSLGAPSHSKTYGVTQRQQRRRRIGIQPPALTGASSRCPGPRLRTAAKGRGGCCGLAGITGGCGFGHEKWWA